MAVVVRAGDDVRLCPVRLHTGLALDAVHCLQVANLFEPGGRLDLPQASEKLGVLCLSGGGGGGEQGD